jgi:hypothetical protein
MFKFFLLAICLTTVALFSNAQQLRINEIMSSNSGAITDSDGDASDWIELFNAGTTSINLAGFGLSDKADQPYKWTFPEYEIAAGQYLLVFASGKDRKEIPVSWNTIISSGDQWKYSLPVSEPTSDWRLLYYNDNNWSTGKSGFGFGDNDDATVIPKSNVIFLRNKFYISDAADVRQLIFHMDYDDGFVAYINGVEIARATMDSRGDFPRFDVFANGSHEALMYQGFAPSSFSVSNPETILKTGQNILAIQVHNSDVTSSDLSAIPFLSIGTGKTNANSRSVELLKLPADAFHTNFKISGEGESIYLTDIQGNSVDSVQVGALAINTSYGRTSKDPSVWGVFATSSPGKANAEFALAPAGSDVPVFSLPGGIYANGIKVSLSAPNKMDSVYFTLDGTEPTLSSTRAQREIDIPISKVLKARILKTGVMPGKVATNSYIIYDNKKLPVVSISMNPDDLWDWNTGIYVDGPNFDTPMPHLGANYWQDWEKPCHIEMIESSGERVIDQDAGLKIFGNWSRVNPQKSLAIHARKIYGPDQIKYKLFGDRPFDEFQSIVLRNSGNDWNNTMFRDGLTATLTNNLNFDKMAYRPSIIFLNGEYWGIQNIREKISEHFIASNNGVNPDSVLMLENDGQVLLGSEGNWFEMYNFLSDNSMSNESNYSRVASQIDISSFIDYFASQIFFANWDWPGNNIRYWKTTDPKSRWRWIMYDTDFSFGIWNNRNSASNSLAEATDPNGPGWPNPPWSTLMLRKLLENTGFRNQFVNRFADLMNTIYLPEKINKAIDQKSNAINDEIGLHLKRWGGDSYSTWLGNVQTIRTFVNDRPYNVFIHIQQKFKFQTPQRLKVLADSRTGTVQLNSIKLTEFPWNGTYYQDVPVTLTAIPNAGFRFLRWEGVTSNSNSRTITVNPKTGMQLTAFFESDGSHYENIVINEISFNNSAQPDPGDWIELFNKGSQDIDLSGWKLTDSDSTHYFTFAANTWIKANDFLVVSNDMTKMKSVFGEVRNLVGTFSFGLGNMTDAVRLYSKTNDLIDEVCYSNVVPWKTFDLKELWSLELKSPLKDNNSGLNWEFSVNYGTPGARNSANIPASNEELQMPENTTHLSQNYPNPFTDRTTIEFKLDQPGKYQLEVLDISGWSIRTFYGESQFLEMHSVYWDGRDEAGKLVPSGVYLYRINSNGVNNMKRMVKM